MSTFPTSGWEGLEAAAEHRNAATAGYRPLRKRLNDYKWAFTITITTREEDLPAVEWTAGPGSELSENIRDESRSGSRQNRPVTQPGQQQFGFVAKFPLRLLRV